MDTYIDDVLRRRVDEAARTVTTWDEHGVQTGPPRDLTPEENARLDAALTNRRREVNRAAILDRITADRSNLRTIASATSFNNAQRDDAIRLIARATLANGRAIEALAGRLAALDDTD